MSAITLRRGEKTAIPFNITDAANGLGGKRVTWSVSRALKVVGGVPDVHLAAPILKKVGALPGSSADITISSQTAGAISGTINIAVADYTGLTDNSYAATLWIDDGAGGDRPTTDGGADTLTILETAPRT